MLNAYERVHSAALRKRSLDECLKQLRFEDVSTKYICIGPVSKPLNMLCAHFADGPEAESVQLHRARLADYLWLAADGMKMQGYNGSQLWDTVFSVQALVDTGLRDEFVVKALRNAYVQLVVHA